MNLVRMVNVRWLNQEPSSPTSQLNKLGSIPDSAPKNSKLCLSQDPNIEKKKHTYTFNATFVCV